MRELENAVPDAEELPYLLFTVGKNIYGINCCFVQSIETLGEVTEITGDNGHIRGGTLYQGYFIPLVDMRKLIGLDSQIDEFEKSVQPEQRIRDHEIWMEALEKSVISRTDFTLTDDPQQCAFGRWFYSFSTENNALRHQLSAIRTPHEEVHKSAVTIRGLMREGRYEDAEEAIADLKATHYKTTISLLSAMRKMVAEHLKELYIVLDTADGVKGVIVDAIAGVEYLEKTLPTSDALYSPPYIECLGQRKNDGRIAIVINNNF